MVAWSKEFFEDVGVDAGIGEVPDSVDVQSLRERVDELEAERDHFREQLNEYLAWVADQHPDAATEEFVDT